MDHLHTRLEALEQRTHTVERQLRWWRGLAGGLLMLAVLTWALPFVTAEDAKPEDTTGLEPRVAALETVLTHFHREGNEVILKGANLRIVNGLGSTDCIGAQGQPIPDCPNGLGNLIVGYNEPRPGGFENIRTGSHNVVVGRWHNFSRFGGLVVGHSNTISGDYAVVSGGYLNKARGRDAVVSGGVGNEASGEGAAVSGGVENTASGDNAAISGGANNTASGMRASVSGGAENTASGVRASVSGGINNTASGDNAAISGGGGNRAMGDVAAVSGGANNTASGGGAAVSGGVLIILETERGWAAGSEGKEVLVGNFRSP